MALELKLSEFHPVPVSFNYQELKKEIAERTLPYKGLIVTEDAIPTAKADLAKLRKLEKAIDDRRKDVKKEYNAPYMEFEAKIKDILSDIQTAIENIDGQVKGFEAKSDEEKLGRIKVFYNLAFGNLAKVVPFDRINNPKWLNKGYKKADIEAEISKMANDLRDNVDAVKALKSENEDALLRKLYLTLDMGEVMKEQAALNAIAEERRAKITQMVEEAQKANSAPSQEPTEAFDVDTPEPLQQIDFRVWVNDEQKAALKHFLVSNGIQYGSVR